MIRINLLPRDERLPEIPHARVSLFFVALFLLVVGGAYAGLEFYNAQLAQDIAAAQTRYEELQPVRVDMAQATDKQRQIDAKLALVNQVVKNRHEPYNIMPRIAQQLSDTVWLDETKVTGDDNGRVLEVKGGTTSYNELAAFISRLEQDAVFSMVTLKSTEGNPQSPILRFTLLLKAKGM